MSDYEEIHKEREREAARRMDGFAYTRLSSGAAEVWRCKSPKDTFYAFDICITRFGIAAFGDFGALVFRVGASYGLPFLAGNDVSYYIHSKLEEDCKRTEFDSEHFHQRQCEAVVERIKGMNEEAGLEEEDEGYLTPPERGEESWEDYVGTLRSYCGKQCEQLDHGTDEYEQWWGMWEFLDEGAESAESAHELFYDNEELLGIGDTWEYEFDKPAESLMHQLYMVRHAAKAILKQKFPEPGTAIGEFGSMGEPVEPA